MNKSGLLSLYYRIQVEFIFTCIIINLCQNIQALNIGPSIVLCQRSFQWPFRAHVLSFVNCQYFRFDVLPVVGNHSNLKGTPEFRRAGEARTDMTSWQVYMAVGDHRFLRRLLPISVCKPVNRGM